MDRPEEIARAALRNAALQWIGDLDSANGATRDLADAILYLAENLGTLANLLLTGAKLWAGYYAAFRVLPAIVVVTLAAMSVVHEDVHQRAGQQEQERQCAKKVRAVLADQEIRSNRAENEQADRIARAPEGLRPGGMLGMVVDHLNIS